MQSGEYGATVHHAFMDSDYREMLHFMMRSVPRVVPMSCLRVPRRTRRLILPSPSYLWCFKSQDARWRHDDTTRHGTASLNVAPQLGKNFRGITLPIRDVVSSTMLYVCDFRPAGEQT